MAGYTFTMRIFGGTACLLLLLLLANTYFAPSTAEPKYNVVIISIDSLRADHMSLLGYPRNTTPHIDTFAQNAVVFKNYYSTSYLTPISEATIHTGKYPITCGMVNFETPIKKEIPTLAEILRTRGWRTAAFGSSLEFQYYPAVRDSFKRGFDMYAINEDYLNLPWRGRGTLRTEKTIEWIDARLAKQQPFFVWFTVGSAHWPYGQDEPHHFSDEKYEGPLQDSGPYTGSALSFIFSQMYGRVYDGKLYDAQGRVADTSIAADIAYVRDRYDDGLVMTDRKLAPFLEYLASPHIAANTIVIIESEHGEDFGEHGYIAHYDILDTQTHTPLIISVPKVQMRHVEALASGVDVLPTLLDLLDIEPPISLDGVSLKDVIMGSSTTPRAEVFRTRSPLWERLISSFTPWLEPFTKEDDRVHFFDSAIRTEKWKLIHRLSRDAQKNYSWWGNLTGDTIVVPEYELYDVQSDPAEKRNIYDAHATNDEIVALRGRLVEWETSMKASIPGHVPPREVQPYF